LTQYKVIKLQTDSTVSWLLQYFDESILCKKIEK